MEFRPRCRGATIGAASAMEVLVAPTRRRPGSEVLAVYGWPDSLAAVTALTAPVACTSPWGDPCPYTLYPYTLSPDPEAPGSNRGGHLHQGGYLPTQRNRHEPRQSTPCTAGVTLAWPHADGCNAVRVRRCQGTPDMDPDSWTLLDTPAQAGRGQGGEQHPAAASGRRDISEVSVRGQWGHVHMHGWPPEKPTTVTPCKGRRRLQQVPSTSSACCITRLSVTMRK